MFFKQKSSVLFRNYESFGYITDNRNFAYLKINNSGNFIGDKILSESGAVFFSVLKKEAQHIDILVHKILQKFIDIDFEAIKNDAFEFYSMLQDEGFVAAGSTIQECEENDDRFNYKILKNLSSENNSTFNNSQRDTQDFFEEYFNGSPQLTNLHIEITSKCNERCIHCYIPHENKITNINSDLFYSIIEQCKEMKLLHLTLSGGEPMLHKNFCDFLKKCREYDFSVNVLSNLTLLDDKIIAEMKANPLLGVQVSLYSMNPIIHDEITQIKGSFEKTRNAILKLHDNNIPMQISCPVMKQNKVCYDEVISWAKLYGIHVGNDSGIIAQYNNGTQNLDCRLSIVDIRDVMMDKISKDIGYLKQIEMEANKKKDITPNDFVCSVCHSSICIAENGNVYPCAGWQGYVVGNLMEESLFDLWNSSEKVKYLRSLRRKDFPKCINCDDKEYCTMCMVRNSNENALGDPLIVNQHFCDVAKLNKQTILACKNE